MDTDSNLQLKEADVQRVSAFRNVAQSEGESASLAAVGFADKASRPNSMAQIGVHQRDTAGAGLGDMYFATRDNTDAEKAPIVRMVIRSDGEVLIRDQQLNVPDHVFDADYELMPLESLRDYVFREKHLPNIPPGDQIRENGLSITGFGMSLLESVEQLTRHVINISDKVEKQRRRIDELESTNNQLQRRIDALECATFPAD